MDAGYTLRVMGHESAAPPLYDSSAIVIDPDAVASMAIYDLSAMIPSRKDRLPLLRQDSEAALAPRRDPLARRQQRGGGLVPEILPAQRGYIASRSPRDGTLRREGKFKLVENTSVIETLEGLNPPTIAIGEQGRDTQPQASTITISDVTDGLGSGGTGRMSATNVSTSPPSTPATGGRLRTCPRRANRGTPPGITATTSLPGAGGVYNNRVYVAWGVFLRSHIDSSGGSVNVASSTNASPIAVTTAVSHGYVTGWMVTIAGHLVNTAANGSWTITVTGPTTFTLDGTTGNGVGVATARSSVRTTAGPTAATRPTVPSPAAPCHE